MSPLIQSHVPENITLFMDFFVDRIWVLDLTSEEEGQLVLLDPGRFSGLGLESSTETILYVWTDETQRERLHCSFSGFRNHLSFVKNENDAFCVD